MPKGSTACYVLTASHCLHTISSSTTHLQVTKIFHELDARGDASGYLTVEDIQSIYDTKSHPDVS